MSNFLKSVIAVAVAVVGGFVAGYIVGQLGKSGVQQELQKAQQSLAAVQTELKKEQTRCQDETQQAHLEKQVMRAKEQLLWSLKELVSNNYGLASQYLARGRTHLKRTHATLPEAEKELAVKLYDQMGDAQTLAMRLDPMASTTIEKILKDMRRLPGGK